jgi:hypothetical protein
VNAERALPRRCIHYFYDGIRHFCNVCIGNRSACEALHDFLAQFRRNTGRILTLKEEILARTISPEGKLVRFMPDDELMTFLNHL